MDVKLQAERHELAVPLDYISKAWGSRKVSESDISSIRHPSFEGSSGLLSEQIAEEALSLRVYLKNLTMLWADRRADSRKRRHFICVGRRTSQLLSGYASTVQGSRSFCLPVGDLFAICRNKPQFLFGDLCRLEVLLTSWKNGNVMDYIVNAGWSP